MNIQELEEKTGHPARLIRFLISQEVVPKPEGGKRYATYGEAHVRALGVYGAAKAEGIESLDVIRSRVARGETWSTHSVGDGIEIRIRDGTFPDTAAFLRRITDLADKAIRGEMK